MRPDAAGLRVFALAFGVCLALATACNKASLQPAHMVADSVKGYSGTQGAHGWYYGYWDRSTDSDQTCDPSIDFKLLTHFGGDPINRLSGHSQFTTGDLWNLQDGLYYTSVWAEGGHANTTLELGTHARAEQWATSTGGTLMTKAAQARFAIMSWEEAPYSEGQDMPKLTRASVKKAFTGDLEGESQVEYLMMYREDGTATFVGMERVVGRIEGKSGSFVLQRTGVYEGGKARESYSVVPGSATGELQGLQGTGTSSVGHGSDHPFRFDYEFV